MEKEPKSPRERAEELISLLVSDWRPSPRQVLWAIRIGIVVSIVVAIGYSYGITLWDWIKLLIVPAVIAAGGLWFNSQQREREQQSANQRAQDEALQAYLDQIGNLLLDKDGPLRHSEEGAEVRTLAEARTVTALKRLDAGHRGSVLDFLRDSQLIGVDKPSPVVSFQKVDFRRADLSGTNFEGANFQEADLREANLREAGLRSAILNGADLRKADLTRADLSGIIKSSGTSRPAQKGRPANCRDADLTGACLKQARLVNTYLNKALLINANLEEADLSEAHLGDAYLYQARLAGAHLRNAVLGEQSETSMAKLDGADLSGADLSGAHERCKDMSQRLITNEELYQQADSLQGATMPNGQKYENWLKSKEGRDEKDRERPEDEAREAHQGEAGRGRQHGQHHESGGVEWAPPRWQREEPGDRHH